MRQEKTPHRWMKPVFPPAVLFLCLLAFSGCGRSVADLTTERTDLVTIDALTVFGNPEKPTVVFPHDLHTGAIEPKNDNCTTCHLKNEKGILAQKFQRWMDSDKDSTMNLYHDKCINCHKETAAKGKKAGPVVCGDCHRKNPAFISTRQPMRMDKSLHYRHIKANEEKCDECHHHYDEIKKKLIYKKGEEEPCLLCHKEKKEENRDSFRFVAHQQCIGCHKAAKPGTAGPTQCAGCHDAQRQQAIKKVENPPRLKRNQPDQVLISAPENELEMSKMNTVPFDHQAHEIYNSSCHLCHEEILRPCTECHTMTENKKNKGILLQKAMHSKNSLFSCIGCHDSQKTKTECAGCHSLMEQGRLSENACVKCHTGPAPQQLQKTSGKINNIKKWFPAKKMSRLSYAKQDIPDSIVISLLENKYEPVHFPHRKMIDALRKDIAKSKLASFFHGSEDMLCQGCHHHTPVGKKPPLCESCHGKSFQESKAPMPGILAAYHRQCLGCHEEMKVEKPSGGCTDCHAKKNKTAITMQTKDKK